MASTCRANGSNEVSKITLRWVFSGMFALLLSLVPGAFYDSAYAAEPIGEQLLILTRQASSDPDRSAKLAQRLLTEMFIELNIPQERLPSISGSANVMVFNKAKPDVRDGSPSSMLLRKNMVLVDGNIRRIVAHNSIIVATGDVDVHNIFNSVIVAGGKIEIGIDDPGASEQASVLVTPQSVKIGTANGTNIYANGDVKISFDGHAVIYNKPELRARGVKIVHSEASALFTQHAVETTPKKEVKSIDTTKTCLEKHSVTAFGPQGESREAVERELIEFLKTGVPQARLKRLEELRAHARTTDNTELLSAVEIVSLTAKQNKLSAMVLFLGRSSPQKKTEYFLKSMAEILAGQRRILEQNGYYNCFVDVLGDTSSKLFPISKLNLPQKIAFYNLFETLSPSYVRGVISRYPIEQRLQVAAAVESKLIDYILAVDAFASGDYRADADGGEKTVADLRSKSKRWLQQEIQAPHVEQPVIDAHGRIKLP